MNTVAERARGNSPPAPWHLRLSILHSFELRANGTTLAVPTNVERVLAFLALRQRPQLRSTVAATLWSDCTEARAGANLRTALWKARQWPAVCVLSTGSYLSLAPTLDVDLAAFFAQAKRLIGSEPELRECDTAIDLLAGDLLPDWDEDWILFERERLRQLRVHALEALCRRLSACGRHGEAIDAGQAAVAAEPLRESAQQCLIAAHIAEGNLCEARRQYQLYRALLWEELAVEPSASLRALIHDTC